MYDKEFVQGAFKDYYGTVHPWMKSKVATDDKKMIAAMKKEAEKGYISFSPVQTNVLRNAAEKFTAPDEFRQKLAASSAKRKARR